MTDNKNHEIRESTCTGQTHNIGRKLMFLLIGGGIGAAVALLFAPKPGSELRHDIADEAGKRYSESLEAAGEFKKRTAEYYQTVKARGGEVLDIVASGGAAVKEEVSSDVERIGEIVENTAKSALISAKGANIA